MIRSRPSLAAQAVCSAPLLHDNSMGRSRQPVAHGAPTALPWMRRTEAHRGRAVSSSGGVARPFRRLENAASSMRTFRPSFLPALTLTASLGFTASTAFAQDAALAPPQADPFAVSEDDYFLLQEPQTPEEFFKGAVQAQRLGRPNLARLYLQQFVALNPDDATLLTLRDDYGPGAFARLANQPELQPLSTELAERVNRVFRERGASPERVGQLLDDVSGPSDKAFAARQALINAGDAVVPAVIQRLQSTTDEDVRRQLIDVLVAMGEPVLPALHATLVGPPDALRVQMIAAIGRIGSTQSISHLFYPAYGPDQPVAVSMAARNSLAEIAQRSRVSADQVRPADAAEQLRQAALRSIERPQPMREAAADTRSDRRASMVMGRGTGDCPLGSHASARSSPVRGISVRSSSIHAESRRVRCPGAVSDVFAGARRSPGEHDRAARRAGDVVRTRRRGRA